MAMKTRRPSVVNEVDNVVDKRCGWDGAMREVFGAQCKSSSNEKR
jgi:hypothetical protein